MATPNMSIRLFFIKLSDCQAPQTQINNYIIWQKRRAGQTFNSLFVMCPIEAVYIYPSTVIGTVLDK